MKSRLLTLLVCFVTSNLIFSQSKVRRPDFFKIQTEVKNSTSDYYLPKLLNRYKKMDTSMSAEEILYLYYGYRMVNNYAPLSYDAKLAKMKQLNSNKMSNNEAIKICDAELEKDIFDMDFLNTKSISFYELKHDKDLSEKQFNFYYNFCKAIHKTGTGLSADSPIYIINTNHIGFLANLIGYKLNGFNKIKNNILVVGLEKNSFGTADLFFDISLTKEYMPTIADNSFAEPTKPNIANADTNINVANNFIASSSVNDNPDITDKKTEFTETTTIEENPKNESLSVVAERQKRKEEVIAERQRIIEERKIAKQKLLEERAAAREQLLEDKKLIRERLLQQRQELKESSN